MMPFLLVSVLIADPPALPPVATFDRAVVESLRDVHDRGATAYNDAKDYAGCRNLYEGALRAVAPLLAHRPAVRARIERGLAKLADEPDERSKAFRLHELIEAVRADLKAPVPAPPPVPLSGVPVAPSVTVTGVVSSGGKPVAGAELQFVNPRFVVTTVVADEKGRYRFTPPGPGQYAVTATGPGIGERFGATNSSGLRLFVGSTGVTKDWILTP